MALYDTKNPLEKANFLLRAKKLAESGKIVELTEKKPKRSLPQNRYLHVILAYFGTQTGNTLEWVKQQYYKKLVNPELFIREKEERFRNWAAQEAGVYLPSSDEHILIQQMEIEIERNKQYL